MECAVCRKHSCVEEISCVDTNVPDVPFVLFLVDAVMWSEFINQCMVSTNEIIMPQTPTGERNSEHGLHI